MKIILATLTIFASMHVAAVEVTSCAEASLTLNNIYSMKKYANGSVKVFEIDMIEPAAAPVGVAIAIDRGDGLSNLESFCRFVPGLSSVSVSGAKSKYDKSTNILTITFQATQSDGNGISMPKVLTVYINKAAKNEVDLVSAELK